ncbi:hypothetical protein MR829_21250 [Paracoccus versutus]|uniref:hypothetical protein n=1 Tax=Paracoccus versutus TaxID=34007 RepID=UPI001FB6CAC2|nr:hypothetical protein [Paracoccus versutus]MCJ1902870.1 hypothetical protein [Paracoccus versutus]
MSVSYDLAFAHAVRQAATGLRTSSGADPEIEGAPLAEILRSDRTLDAHGLELLAQLVTGNLRKVRQPAGESILAHAVRRAGAAWRRGKGADPLTTGAALASALRGDPARLGPGERALIADLVTGELRRGTSRPPKGAGHLHVETIVEAFRKRIADGLVRKNALNDTAIESKISERTIETYLAMTEEREAMLRVHTKLARFYDLGTVAKIMSEWRKHRSNFNGNEEIPDEWLEQCLSEIQRQETAPDT